MSQQIGTNWPWKTIESDKTPKIWSDTIDQKFLKMKSWRQLLTAQPLCLQDAAIAVRQQSEQHKRRKPSPIATASIADVGQVRQLPLSLHLMKK